MPPTLEFDSLETFEATLPPVVTPLASYVTAVQAGDLLYTAGVLPMREGQVCYTGAVGNILMSLSEAQAAAELCCINVLSVIKAKLGSLQSVEQIVKLTGYIQTTPHFTQHAQVMNGASDLLVKVFGERGRHARTSIGVMSLPLNASVEIDVVLRVSPTCK